MLLPLCPRLFPRKQYIVETDLDKARAQEPDGKEFFEDIGSVESHIRLDTVFEDESDIPGEYRETFTSSRHPVETRIFKSASTYLPQATTFTNTAGEVARYYFKNNPWKFSDANRFQKIFRFCVICGDNRFSDEKWSGALAMFGRPPTICSKLSCWNALASMPATVPRKQYIVETDLDKARAQEPDGKEFFEDIGSVESHIRLDTVFEDESDIPGEYRETFTRLEGIPVETRIFKIDEIYFDFKESHNIEIGETMMDTRDPFLKALAAYRQKRFIFYLKSSLKK